MTRDCIENWDPQAEDVSGDQRAAQDAMRESSPVAYGSLMHGSRPLPAHRLFRYGKSIDLLKGFDLIYGLMYPIIYN